MIARGVVTVGGRPSGPACRAMTFTNATGPRGVSSVKGCSSTTQPVALRLVSMAVRAWTTSGEPEGRGPKPTCRATSAIARSPENSFHNSAGGGEARNAGFALRIAGFGGSAVAGASEGVAAPGAAGGVISGAGLQPAKAS